MRNPKIQIIVSDRENVPKCRVCLSISGLATAPSNIKCSMLKIGVRFKRPPIKKWRSLDDKCFVNRTINVDVATKLIRNAQREMVNGANRRLNGDANSMFIRNAYLTALCI